MKKIPLSGKYVLINDEDFEIVNLFKWHLSSSGYAMTEINILGNKINIFMHRLINNTPFGMFTDHVNHINLDNRKENLRSCTISQNNFNKKISKGKSHYKGVYKQNNKWRSRIKINYKFIHLGYFCKETEAAKAYNKKALELFGEFAYLNNV